MLYSNDSLLITVSLFLLILLETFQESLNFSSWSLRINFWILNFFLLLIIVRLRRLFRKHCCTIGICLRNIVIKRCFIWFYTSLSPCRTKKGLETILSFGKIFLSNSPNLSYRTIMWLSKIFWQRINIRSSFELVVLGDLSVLLISWPLVEFIIHWLVENFEFQFQRTLNIHSSVRVKKLKYSKLN